MKITGIYKIQSRIKSERIYIGSTVDINRRWRSHIIALRKNKHHSKKLQRHYIKYQESDLQFSILLRCEKEDLLKMEQYFLDVYHPYFNNSKKAGNCMGVKHSKATRIKYSKAKKGKKYFLGKHHSEDTRDKMRKPKSLRHRLCLSLAHKGKPSSRRRKVIDISSYTIYDSIDHAAEEIGVKRSTLNMQLLGLNKNKTNLRYYGT